MSGRRYKDWLSEALEDLSIAKILLKEDKYAASCFHSQQAAEKASKALLLLLGRFEPGHSVSELLLAARESGANVTEEHIQYARILDRYYIPTRYPNAFERGAPHEYFLMRDAEEAVRLAEEIVKLAEKEAGQG
ncbi:MAG: HEPN domain-containing protein [Candidatus Bathyarchaeia archaeon]|nr:HEPN domain-containing protein [Candidatus Bathyarchaeota archaeon]